MKLELQRSHQSVRKNSCQVKIWGLFKLTVTSKAVCGKHRVLHCQVFTLMKTLKKGFGGENVKKTIFLCLSVSHIIFDSLEVGMPQIGPVETSVITENFRVREESIKHLWRSSFSF